MRKLNPDILAHHIQLQADRTPDRTVLIFESPIYGDRRITNEDLWKRSNRLAAYWQERGLEKGDCVALLMRNYPEYLYAIIASSITGILSVAIDPRTRGQKLLYQLNRSGARLAVCTPETAGEIALLKGETSIEAVLVHDPAGFGHLDGMTAIAPILDDDSLRTEQGVHALSDAHQIIYTSGTTGDPKAFVLDHARALAARGLYDMMRASADDVFYTGLSLTHANAQMMTAYPALWKGNLAVISESFTKRRLWDICRAHGCTTFTSLGGIMSGLYAEPARPDDAENPVRIVHSAGTPPAIWDAFEKRFDLKIHEWYGTLEGSVATRFPDSGAPSGSFGKALPGAWTMKVVREDFTECGPYEIGQLIARPASGQPYEVVYFKDPEASRRKTRDGWLLTGDMVHADEEGWLYFDFRQGGGIRRNGDFVQPSQVERILAEHQQVDDVFVYGVEAKGGAPGECDIVAAIVPVEKGCVNVSGIFELCEAGLEKNFVPTFIQIVDEIPKTISEKPQERFLRELLVRYPERVFSR